MRKLEGELAPPTEQPPCALPHKNTIESGSPTIPLSPERILISPLVTVKSKFQVTNSRRDCTPKRVAPGLGDILEATADREKILIHTEKAGRPQAGKAQEEYPRAPEPRAIINPSQTMPDKKNSRRPLPVPVEDDGRRIIYIMRGKKVMLDSDLAELYQCHHRALSNLAVRRKWTVSRRLHVPAHQSRRPRLCYCKLQEQKSRRGLDGDPLPYAFTELGVAMLSSVLNSERAVQMNIDIMRAFVRKLSTHRDLVRKMEELEKRHRGHAAQIKTLIQVFKELHRIAETRPAHQPRIGFITDEK